MTSLGAATTKTQINGGSNVVMPSWARSIVAVVPYIAQDVYEADEPAVVKFNFESDDCNIIPYEILSNPIAGYGDTAGVPFHAQVEKYIMNCPLNGGEEIAIWGTPLQGITGPVYGGATLVISDRSYGKQRFGKVGTLTGTGTGAAEVAGTAYSIHGAERLIEVTGICVPEAIAADDAYFGSFRITSGDFKVAVPLSYGYQPSAAAEADSYGTPLPAPARYKVDIPTNKTCVLQDYCTSIIGPSVEGRFVTAVMFEKAGR